MEVFFFLYYLNLTLNFPRFDELFHENDTTFDIFKTSVQPALDLLLGGCNLCFLVSGETGSGKSYTLAGEGQSQAGLAPMVLEHLLTRLFRGKSFKFVVLSMAFQC